MSLEDNRTTPLNPNEILKDDGTLLPLSVVEEGGEVGLKVENLFAPLTFLKQKFGPGTYYHTDRPSKADVAAEYDELEGELAIEDWTIKTYRVKDGSYAGRCAIIIYNAEGGIQAEVYADSLYRIVEKGPYRGPTIGDLQ